MLLRALDGDDIFECAGNTFVGRGLVDGLNVDSTRVSSLHAVITWHMGRRRWLLHDLGSRNGTRVAVGPDEEGQPVEPGKAMHLQPGMHVYFARTGYVVDEASPPPARAVAIGTGEVRVASDGVLMLPDDRDPDVVLVEAADGWTVRKTAPGSAPDTISDTMPDTLGAMTREAIDEGTTLPLSETTLTAGGRSWRLWRPHPTLETRRAAHSVASYVYEVVVSPDGESVRLVLRGPKGTVVLPPRRHHELVWVLARAWHQDSERPLPDRGWRDTSTLGSQMLADGSYIGVLLHRLRNQLRKRGITDADALIERRSGQLRLAPVDVRIIDQGRV